MLWCLRGLSILSLWWMVFLPHSVFAVENEPTTITSKTMTANNEDRQAIFRGDVILTQGDLVVRSDIMIVRFKSDQTSEPTQSEEKSESPGGKIDVIEAKGKVVIKKADGRATCRHAVYYKDQEKIVLTGAPIAWQGGTRVSGPKMTMYLEENRSVVEGGTRVIIADQEST